MNRSAKLWSPSQKYEILGARPHAGLARPEGIEVVWEQIRLDEAGLVNGATYDS